MFFTTTAAPEPPKKKQRLGDGFTFTVTRMISDTMKAAGGGSSVVAHFKNGDKVRRAHSLFPLVVMRLVVVVQRFRPQVATDRDYFWSGIPKKFSDPPVWYHRGPWKGKGRYVKFKANSVFESEPRIHWMLVSLSTSVNVGVHEQMWYGR